MAYSMRCSVPALNSRNFYFVVLVFFRFMKISPTSLAVNCRELINFHGCLTLFLVKLDQFKPLGHPSSPDHPPIRPSIMLNFALQPNYREKLNRGLNQLVELRTILHCCKDKVS